MNTQMSMRLLVSGKARDQYGLDKFYLFDNGQVILSDFHSARVFVQEINEQPLHAGRLS